MRWRYLTNKPQRYLLKKWFPHREPERAYVHMVTDEQEELPCIQQDQQDLGSATYGEQLTEEQKAQVKEVISQFPQISQQQPGRTTELTHRIVTTDQQPIRLRPYRIPPAVKDDVVSELQELLKSGIVEDTSEWAAPIVVVKKKDGTNCICVDYRKLNTFSHSSYLFTPGYLMPQKMIHCNVSYV